MFYAEKIAPKTRTAWFKKGIVYMYGTLTFDSNLNAWKHEGEMYSSSQLFESLDEAESCL